MPLFSVLVIVDGIDGLLFKCINSVLRQSIADLELLVVCDDPFAEQIASRLDHDDERLHLIRATRDETIAQRINQAIAYSTGSWLLILSGKETLQKHSLQRFADTFAQHSDLALLGCASRSVTVDGLEIENHVANEQPQLTDGRLVRKEELLGTKKRLRHPSTVCFRKPENSLALDPRYLLLSPFDFFLRLAGNGNCLFLPDVLTDIWQFEHNCLLYRTKESLVWLLDFATLHDAHATFMTEAGVEPGAWRWAIHEQLVSALTDHFKNLRVTRSDVVAASQSLANSHQLYPELSCELAFQILAGVEAREELRAAKQNAYKRGWEDAQREADEQKRKLNSDFESRLTKLKEELTTLKDSEQRMLNSISWRVTAPLRNVARSLSKS
jgi:glycosyltransferase involved in cell wall biosynthesis